MQTDYLIVGSGLSALVFGALMARRGKRVLILEAHVHPGGFGHTFTLARKYTFNAQLHYVWDCGEGDTVYRVLQHLGLERQITFERYDPDGFDHMRAPGYALAIPADPEELIRRLCVLFPAHVEPIRRFVLDVQQTCIGLKALAPPLQPLHILRHWQAVGRAGWRLNSTLQNVFDHYRLPRAAQTLLALQWPDFLLPPNLLSYFAWVILFTGYQRGAYYASQHFERVIGGLVDVITKNGGEVRLGTEVTGFSVEDGTITGLEARNVLTGATEAHVGQTVICNMDPRRAAQMIGLEHFAPDIRRRLDYEYSPSNFMAYCVVRDLDLRDYGFGKWNTFHTEELDLNTAFERMYRQHDYSRPSFAITTPTLLTDQCRDCPPDCQVIEFLTVADYAYFRQLRQSNPKAYRAKKAEILDSILDIIERDYVPSFRRQLVLAVTGGPTTNERFCWSPQGNSYGSSLTPRNMGLGRLGSHTSIRNLHFCNASAGYPGFAPTFWTGALLYQKLSGDPILSRS